MGEYEKSIKDYDRAIQYGNDCAKTYCNRGIVKANLGGHSEAIEDYDEAIRLNLDDVFAYNDWGIAQTKLGKCLEAIEDYDWAIKLDLDDENAYNNRGIAKFKLGDKDGARQDLLRAKELVEELGDEELLEEINQHLSELDDKGTDT